MLLTKEKILELQSMDSNGIKSFINLLPFYGNEISLIKHRPNREKYPVGKAQEPSIKIDVSNFTRRIDEKLRENPQYYKHFKNMKIENREKLKNENNAININLMSSRQNDNGFKNNKSKEDINKDFMGNSSSSIMNIFNIKSTKIIKYIDFLIYFFIISTATVEFVLSYLFLVDNKLRFKYLSDSYTILTHICYTKYFITEAIISNNSYLDMGTNENEKKKYISYLKSEYAFYLQEFTNLFELYSNSKIEFSKEYKYFLSNTKINIKTLNNGKQIIEEQPFIAAINKLTTAVFYLSNMRDNEAINMSNKYSYELMHNLLNGYFVTFEKLIKIMLEDFKNKTKSYRIKSIIVFFITISISIIYIIVFWKLMSKLDNDREKPINLFLTIKKKVFEDLKSSSENFSNKLLNKFFGNEENEEESQQEYISNVKSNDINIAKFKALNEYKASINKKSSFIFYFIQIIILFSVYNLFFLIKYIGGNEYYKITTKFIKIYNETRFSHIYLVARINIVKQFFMNNSISNFNYSEELIPETFYSSFLLISAQFGETLISSSKMNSFLDKNYKDYYKKYVYSDYIEIMENNNYLMNLNTILNYTSNVYIKTDNGFKETSLNIFEIIRYLSIQYFMNDTRNIYNISNVIYDEKWIDLIQILTSLVRPWYKNIVEILNSVLYSLAEEFTLIYISLFIFLFLGITFYYWIVWKSYEENFINLIKKSFDLINLIPEEIKNIIVFKLNE